MSLQLIVVIDNVTKLPQFLRDVLHIPFFSFKIPSLFVDVIGQGRKEIGKSVLELINRVSVVEKETREILVLHTRYILVWW